MDPLDQRDHIGYRDEGDQCDAKKAELRLLRNLSRVGDEEDDEQPPLQSRD
jgi:hypothetical protein